MQEGYGLEKTVTKLKKTVLYFDNRNCIPVSVRMLVFTPDFNAKSENQRKSRSISAFTILKSLILQSQNLQIED